MIKFLKIKRIVTALATTALVGTAAYAVAPPAGEEIGNQSSATYTNSSGDSVTVTSNKVITIVQQVAGVDLAADTAKEGAAGGRIFIAHTIKNTGNGADTFSLAAVNAGGDDFDFTNIRIFADANMDGVADNTAVISTTPPLDGSGGTNDRYGIIIEATIPGAVSAADTGDITVTATSAHTPGTLDTNTDTITISDAAIVELTKSMTWVDGDGDGLVEPGETVNIVLNYSNIGIASASAYSIQDILPSTLTYTAGSAAWSDSATTPTDASDAQDLTNGGGQVMNYEYTLGSNTVDITIDSVPAGRSGFVSFSATITAGTQAVDINNTATQNVGATDFPDSNTATITVDDLYQVSIADYETSAFNGGTDDGTNRNGAGLTTTEPGAPPAYDDTFTYTADAPQGSAIPFDFIVTNHSNTSQSFNITYTNTDFPAGTIFSFYRSDGVTPLSGTLGPIAAGGAEKVYFIAQLAPDAAAVTTANYTAVISAQALDGGLANTATAEFTGNVTAATVDLYNGADNGGDGADLDGTDNAGAAWDTVAVNPNVKAVFDFVVENESTVRADSYDLTVIGIPAGYFYEFVLPNGTPISNTGSIAKTATLDFSLEITPPSNAAAGTTNFTVVATSPSTGQSDSMLNAITVNEVIDIAITADQLQQGAPAGVIDIPHVLTNLGNIAITEGALTVAGFTEFSGTIFLDADNNGVVSAGDTAITNISDIGGGVIVGGSVNIVFRVQVPSTAAVGLTETATITVASSLNTASKTDGSTGNNSVRDTVTIVTGDLVLVKRQTIDPACDGNPGTYTTNAVNAEPGQCISYEIVAENTGSANVDTVVLTDQTPNWTVFTECTASACAATRVPGSATLTKPAEGVAGQVKVEFGTIIPGGRGTLTFTVQIAQ